MSFQTIAPAASRNHIQPVFVKIGAAGSWDKVAGSGKTDSSVIGPDQINPAKGA